MKLSLAERGRISRAGARNAMALNLLATPGLGSLLCRRWVAGSGQLLLSLAGCAFVCVWFVKVMAQLYALPYAGGQGPEPRVGWIGETGAGLVAVAWVWSLATSLSLMGQAAREGAGRLANSGGPPRLKLGPDAVASALRSVPDWRRNGDAICRTFVFKDFPAAMKFVEAVAGIAEREWHHPDILVQWNKVTLTLTTHDAGGLTDRDFALASMFDLSANERQ